MQILLVEDDAELSRELVRLLKDAGNHVERHSRGDGLQLDKLESKFDVAILDIGLPGMNGFEVVEAIRASGVNLPVLFLSARGDVEDRVRGLAAGGDDYLVKPFSAPELMARLAALHRRSQRQRADMRIDIARRRFIEGEGEIELQPKELAMLSVFLKNEGVVLTKSFLLDKVWDIRFDPGTNVVDAMICRVRGKMEAAGFRSAINTVRGKGYVFHSGH